MATASQLESLTREKEEVVVQGGAQVALGARGQWLPDHLDRGAAKARDDPDRDDETRILERHEQQPAEKEPCGEEWQQHKQAHERRRRGGELLLAVLEPLRVGRDQLSHDGLERIAWSDALVGHQAGRRKDEVGAQRESDAQEECCDEVAFATGCKYGRHNVGPRGHGRCRISRRLLNFVRKARWRGRELVAANLDDDWIREEINDHGWPCAP